MDINISISSGNVNSINNTTNLANITVDLTELWDGLKSNYSDVCINVDLQIPTLEAQSGGSSRETNTKTNIVKNMRISDITDKKVIFSVNYPGNLDVSRQAVGSATVTGYNVVGSI